MSTPGMMESYAPSDGTEAAEGDSTETPTIEGDMGEVQLSMPSSSPSWTVELQNLGFSQPIVKSLSGNKIWFEDISGKEYIGFMNLSGHIVRSEPAQTRTNNKIFGAEAPEGPDDI
jgi:hypothetical protein